MCVPALAWLLRPGLAPVGFSSSQAAETGFNCQVASGHHFSVCKVSLVTLTHGFSDGQEDVLEEQISRTVCTRVKGVAALSHYKICVLFKIKHLYGLQRESRCWAGISAPGLGLAVPCAALIHLHKTTETFAVV